uniref:Uncharacterized protein n=1 Tax=Cacopsylla melanoneura TaxID=428564 RepID=A0A8D8QTM0_9HEMI
MSIFRCEKPTDSIPVNNGHSSNGNCVKVLNTTKTKSTPKPTPPIDQNKLFESMSMGSQSLFPDSFDFNKHIELLGNNSSTSVSQDGKKNSKKNEVPSHLQYAALAVVVRLMIYFQVGWMFGEMILVPFMLTESIQLSLGHVHTSQLISMLGQFCGFSSQLAQTYSKVNSILLHCIENFSVYLVVFCIVHRLLDEDHESR